MSVHYRFVSSKDKRWDTIGFDSAVISVLDLKRAIVAALANAPKGTAPVGPPNFDLILTNQVTGERYLADNFLIPKNTSVEVRKTPSSADKHKRLLEPTEVTLLAAGTAHLTLGSSDDPSQISPEDEEARRLESVLNQPPAYAGGLTYSKTKHSSGLIHDLSAAVNAPAAISVPTMPVAGAAFGGRRPQFVRTGKPRPGYICHRCQTPGHFIHECPTNGNSEFNFQRPKPITGIPISMLKPAAEGKRGAFLLDDGRFADIEPNQGAFEDAFRPQDRALDIMKAKAAAESATRITYVLPPVLHGCAGTFIGNVPVLPVA
ncbi:unnamed protein product (mitochondrion) [Plasmodiophora brassicae]|uniref:DWNN domain-containing protein n=1 Tax=Plasmodiophora brassicae TaxID=37360 RepID=A0A3P3YBJ6_PLABS|nr:unnamed protein product [Plasmodiophora brassicae]